MTGFSVSRFLAMLGKEWTQMRRDPTTIGLTVILPLVQLFLFGFAINTTPHHLPTGLLAAENTREVRSLTAALTNTGYFDLQPMASEAEAERALVRGEVLFVLNVPAGFSRALDRGEHPALLMDADATDPTAISAATAALSGLNGTVLAGDLPPALQSVPTVPPFQVVLHGRYNPEQLTAFNIVPGLIGTILLFSTLISTALAITREREGGTMENLLAMPLRPVEVMLGKIVPYIGLGYVQIGLILVAARMVFAVPVHGSIALLLAALGLFIACNLALGFAISTLARSQMQAMQTVPFVLLPSLLLSGFLFPFDGMPLWARMIGEAIPLTHILRIARGILLKGSTLADIAPELWPMALFALAVGTLAVRAYRETLD